MTEESADSNSETDVLRRVSPTWAWLRDNFKLPAVLSIAAVVAVCGSAVLKLDTDVALLKQQIEQLQRDIVRMTQSMPDTAMLASLRTEVADHDERIGRLEDSWDHAAEISQRPPLRRQK